MPAEEEKGGETTGEPQRGEVSGWTAEGRVGARRDSGTVLVKPSAKGNEQEMEKYNIYFTAVCVPVVVVPLSVRPHGKTKRDESAVLSTASEVDLCGPLREHNVRGIPPSP